MRHPLSSSESEVLGIAFLLFHIKVSAIRLVVPSFAWRLDRPEIVEDMCMYLGAFTWFGVNLPDPNAVGLGYQCIAHLTVVGSIDELLS